MGYVVSAVRRRRKRLSMSDADWVHALTGARFPLAFVPAQALAGLRLTLKTSRKGQDELFEDQKAHGLSLVARNVSPHRFTGSWRILQCLHFAHPSLLFFSLTEHDQTQAAVLEDNPVVDHLPSHQEDFLHAHLLWDLEEPFLGRLEVEDTRGDSVRRRGREDGGKDERERVGDAQARDQVGRLVRGVEKEGGDDEWGFWWGCDPVSRRGRSEGVTRRGQR